jgi:uncharacterized repeat protein (TIGR03806 family)
MDYSLHRAVGVAFLPFACVLVSALAAGCSSSDNTSGNAPAAGGASAGGAGQNTAGSAGSNVGPGGAGAGGGGGAPIAGGTGGASGGSSGSAGTAGTGGSPAVVGTCSPPDDIYSPIQNLSLTGCVDPTDPTKLSTRAVPYEVNSPLWSDGADKTRAFVLPDGKKIHVDATSGKWVFPVGSVLIKNFLFDGKFVETRLFMHVDDMSWAGYSYKWNGQGAAKQTEATVVGIDRDDIVFDTGKQTVHWYYPSREDCAKCHNDVAGNSLGPDNSQMYRVATGHTMNQFDELNAKGVFDAAPTPPSAAQVLPLPYHSNQLGDPPAAATLDQKARSYLQANCAHCHQPNSGFIMSPFPNFDLRYGTTLKDAKICNAEVSKGAVPGSTSTKILVPGKPMDSIMWLRMNAAYTDTGTMVRMPQIATHVVDAAGVKLIGDWITAIAACP